jgi:acyl-CoA reductase-like NAD-dependent aldehyde dehydrogenase
MGSLTIARDIRTDLYIDGAYRRTDDRIEVVDPADPSVVVGTAAAATSQDAQDAVIAAKNAFRDWSRFTPRERAKRIAAAMEGMEDYRDEDARLLTQENGKPFQESWVDFLVLGIRTTMALELADEVDEEKVLLGPPVTTTVGYQPLGVVTIIVPFNWPIAILGASLPHALLAGNAVIVKPPPSTPLAMSRALARMAEKLPRGVLNVITGRDADMAPLIQNDDVAKVCFTGSVGGGKRIAAMAAETLTRVTLELGGNDAAIIFDDAKLDDEAYDRLYQGIFDTAGQVCMNAKRIYVHRARFDEVVKGLSDRLERVVLGHGLSEGTTMGPLHQQRQKEFVAELIAEAKESGAEVREFGTLPPDLPEGRFLRPALVLDPDPALRVVTEEQFGPVAPLIPFDTEDEVVRLADDTWGGLCASVWSADPARVRRVAEQLQVGMVFVNDHGANRLDLRAPFGGMRASGSGREQGIEGIRDFQDTRSIGTLHVGAV